LILADFFWPFTVAPDFFVGTGIASVLEVVENEAREGMLGRERQRQQLSGVAILAIFSPSICRKLELEVQ
jgi:hypothetical protein